MLFAIAVGGALGSVVRHLLGTFVAARTSGFPWGTLAINVTGSLLLGFLVRSLADPAHSPALRAALTVGFCGGYTTFSAFSVETLALVQQGSWGRATVYALASVLLGVAAAVAGTALARSLRAGSP
jgi:CrcB protein